MITIPFERRVCKMEFGPIFKHRYMGSHMRGYETPEKLVGVLADAGLEAVMVGLTDREGYTLCSPSEVLPTDKQESIELMKRFIAEANRRDLQVLGEFALLLWPQLYESNPEWLMVPLMDHPDNPAISKREGSSLKNKSFFCIHSPFRNWICTLLSEHARDFQLDGFWFDDTNFGPRNGFPWPAGCRCEYCKQLYKAEKGTDLPETVDWENKEFLSFMHWRQNKLIEFFEEAAAGVHRARPGIPMIYNHYTLNKLGWETAQQLAPYKKNYLLFTEENYSHAISAKIMRAENPDYFEVWNWATEVIPGVQHGMPPYAAPYSSIQTGMTVMANGGVAVIAGITGDFELLKDYLEAVFDEYKKRRDYVGGESLSSCAVLLSGQTRDFHGKDKPELYRINVQGIGEALERSRLIWDIVLDKQVTKEHLAKYEVLYLPNTACMSEEQCGHIRDFVRSGGVLVATEETSLYDADGTRLDNFRLSDVFGADYLYKDERGVVPEDPEGFWAKLFESGQGIIYVNKEENISQQFKDIVSFSASNCFVREKADAEVVCSLSERTHLLNRDLSIPLDGIHPGVLRNKYGKGTCYYISADLGSAYMRTPVDRLRQFIVYFALTVQHPIEVSGPSDLRVSAFRKDGTLQIHLYSHRQPVIPHGLSEHTIRTSIVQPGGEPLRGEVKVKLNGLKAKRAYSPLNGIELMLEEEGTCFRLSEIQYHDVICLELIEE